MYSLIHSFIWLHWVLAAARGIFYLWQAGSPVMECGIQFLNQGSNPLPLPWECEVPATGLSGKAPSNLLLILISWPLPMNHQSVQSLSCVNYVRFTMNHKYLLNVASVTANPFQKVFNLLCPDLSEELLWQLEPYKMHFLKNKTWKSKLLLDPWAANRMLWTWISLYISIRALGQPGALSMNSNILKAGFFLRSRSQQWAQQ